MKKFWFLFLVTVVGISVFLFSLSARAQPVGGDVAFEGSAFIGNELTGAFGAGSGESSFESGHYGGEGNATGTLNSNAFSSGSPESPDTLSFSGSSNLNSGASLNGKGVVLTRGSAEAGSWLTHETEGGLKIIGGSLTSSLYEGSASGRGPEVGGSSNAFSSTWANTSDPNNIFSGTFSSTNGFVNGVVIDPASTGSGAMTMTFPNGSTFGTAEFNSVGPNASNGSLNISGNVFTFPEGGGVSMNNFVHVETSAK